MAIDRSLDDRIHAALQLTDRTTAVFGCRPGPEQTDAPPGARIPDGQGPNSPAQGGGG